MELNNSANVCGAGSSVSSILCSEDSLYVLIELTDGIFKSMDEDKLDSKWYCPSS